MLLSVIIFNARLIVNKCYTNEDYQINGTQKDSGQRKRPVVYKDTLPLRTDYVLYMILTKLSRVCLFLLFLPKKN